MEIRLTQSAEPINLKVFVATRREFLLGVLCILVGVLIVVMAAIPQINQARELRQDIRAETKSLEGLENKLSQLKNISFDPDFEERQVVLDALPSRKPLLELLNSLSVLVEDVSVGVGSMALKPGEVATDAAALRQRGPGPVDSLEISMGVTGTFDNVQAFLTRIEQISPFTTITELTLSTPRRVSADAGVSATLTLESYYFTRTVTQTLAAPLPIIGAPEKTVLAALQSFAPDTYVEQTEIRGGGLERFFTADELQFAAGPVGPDADGQTN